MEAREMLNPQAQALDALAFKALSSIPSIHIEVHDLL